MKFVLGSNSASEHARDMVLVSTPMFWGIGNHLGSFSASDPSEGQEKGGWGCKSPTTTSRSEILKLVLNLT